MARAGAPTQEFVIESYDQWRVGRSAFRSPFFTARRGRSARTLVQRRIHPEGVLPLPARNLLVVANEADPEEGLPSTITLFEFTP